MTPKISIVTVVFNAATTLEKTIQSVAQQTYKDIEYVVVDGGSTDGTMDIVRKNERYITKWVSERDKGIYDAMNKGVKLCSGQWIYFLGADDVLTDAGVVEQIVRHFHHANEVIYGDVIFKHAGSRYDGRFGSFKIVTRNIPHQALFYPKSVFDSFTFDTLYRVYADYHLNLRLYNDKRWKFKYMPIAVAIFDDTGSSGSGQPDAAFERDLNAIIKANFAPVYYFYRVLRSKLAKLSKR